MSTRFAHGRRTWALSIVGLVAALVFSVYAPSARADMVHTTVFDTDQFLSGASLQVTPLQITAPGTLQISLTDLKFTDAFKSLSFALTNSTGVLERLTVGSSGSGILSYEVGSPMTLYVAVFALPNSGRGGLYHLDCGTTGGGVTAVPVPSSLGLAMSALAGLVFLRRRNIAVTNLPV